MENSGNKLDEKLLHGGQKMTQNSVQKYKFTLSKKI